MSLKEYESEREVTVKDLIKILLDLPPSAIVLNRQEKNIKVYSGKETETGKEVVMICRERTRHEKYRPGNEKTHSELHPDQESCTNEQREEADRQQEKTGETYRDQQGDGKAGTVPGRRSGKDGKKAV